MLELEMQLPCKGPSLKLKFPKLCQREMWSNLLQILGAKANVDNNRFCNDKEVHRFGEILFLPVRDAYKEV